MKKNIRSLKEEFIFFVFQIVMFNFIFRFQKACAKYGVPDVDLFQSTDLWDQKNIALVTQTIFALGRTVLTFL